MSLDIDACRFAADSKLFGELTQEPSVKQGMAIREAARRRETLRASLLGTAVSVDPKVVPHLAAAFNALVDRIPQLDAIECYVYNEPKINAFVSQSHSRTLVGLSSGAVNSLTDVELIFVIGHELGHALFEHTGLDVNGLTTHGGLQPKVCMRLRAWQRAAEISADRAGLICCDSLEAAASALFKTVSGLAVDKIDVRPEEFAGQWRPLAEEVADAGDRSQWEFSHPFPPLRMTAMLFYWRAKQAQNHQALVASEEQITQMLALMDPSAGEGPLNDALLSSFFFWGGLYIALADGRLDQKEVSRLQTVAPNNTDVEAVVSDSGFRDEVCVERFSKDVKTRRKKLSAVEQHRIVYGLIDVAAADGRVASSEMSRLQELGGILGIPAAGCDLIVGQHKEDAKNVG